MVGGRVKAIKLMVMQEKGLTPLLSLELGRYGIIIIDVSSMEPTLTLRMFWSLREMSCTFGVWPVLEEFHISWG
jgi:hypothetical protein